MIVLCVESLDIVPKNVLQESPCGQIYSVLGAKVMVISLVYVQVETHKVLHIQLFKVHRNKLNVEGEREGAVAVDEVEIVSYMK